MEVEKLNRLKVAYNFPEMQIISIHVFIINEL
jgi:hypothetical protein